MIASGFGDGEMVGDVRGSRRGECCGVASGRKSGGGFCGFHDKRQKHDMSSCQLTCTALHEGVWNLMFFCFRLTPK